MIDKASFIKMDISMRKLDEFEVFYCQYSSIFWHCTSEANRKHLQNVAGHWTYEINRKYAYDFHIKKWICI